MFTKKTLGGNLPDNLINLINDNYQNLFETTNELTSLQMIEMLVNKALQAKNETINLLEENKILLQKIEKYKTIFQKYISTKSSQISELQNKNFVDLIGKEFYNLLVENTKAKSIKEFYASFTNKDLIKKIDSENEMQNVVNLLRNAYMIRMLKGRYQPQITSREQIYNAFKN